MRMQSFIYCGVLFCALVSSDAYTQTIRVPSISKVGTTPPTPPPTNPDSDLPPTSKQGQGSAGSLPVDRMPDVNTIAPAGAANPAQTTAVPTFPPQTTKMPYWFFPTFHVDGKTPQEKQEAVNEIFDTGKNLSFFNQIKSIYNGASGSATVSADLASLNFRSGFQVVASTNIQAGSTDEVPHVSTDTIPTLSSAEAGQATQNMLYGGTLTVGAVVPMIYAVRDPDKAGGWGIRIDAVAREGVDIQDFKSGTNTSTNTNNATPPTHGAIQMEGYIINNSINHPAGQPDGFVGSIFFGGSFGYSYTSHGYARDYGIHNVNNSVAETSAGILINNVAKVSVSRAFGPSQTYIDNITGAKTTKNNFNSWSFGITYQTPSPPSQ